MKRIVRLVCVPAFVILLLSGCARESGKETPSPSVSLTALQYEIDNIISERRNLIMRTVKQSTVDIGERFQIRIIAVPVWIISVEHSEKRTQFTMPFGRRD